MDTIRIITSAATPIRFFKFFTHFFFRFCHTMSTIAIYHTNMLKSREHSRFPVSTAITFARYRSVPAINWNLAAQGLPLWGRWPSLRGRKRAVQRCKIDCSFRRISTTIAYGNVILQCKITTSSVTFGDTFPKGEGMRLAEICPVNNNLPTYQICHPEGANASRRIFYLSIPIDPSMHCVYSG